MRKLLGTKIEVHLKDDQGVIFGMLFDIEGEYVCIQDSVSTHVTIPKNNIKFYVSNSLQNIAEPQPVQSNTQPVAQPAEPSNNILTVGVDGEIVSQISIPPTMNLGTCSEEILRLIWGDLDVQNALRGRVQTSLEYDIGYANIVTTEAINLEIKQSEEDSFSMGAGSIISNPIDMAKIISGGKNEQNTMRKV